MQKVAETHQHPAPTKRDQLSALSSQQHLREFSCAKPADWWLVDHNLNNEAAAGSILLISYDTENTCQCKKNHRKHMSVFSGPFPPPIEMPFFHLLLTFAVATNLFWLRYPLLEELKLKSWRNSIFNYNLIIICCRLDSSKNRFSCNPI